MKLARPSRSVTLATVAVGAALAAGGYELGHRSDVVSPPATVPVRSASQPKSGDTILVPRALELPSR